MTNDGKVNSLKLTETGTGVRFTVHVQPRASRNEICGIKGDELKVRLTAPPVDDAANRLCIEFLAGELKVAKSRLSITAGSKSRHKTIKVSGMGGDLLLSRLGISSTTDSSSP